MTFTLTVAILAGILSIIEHRLAIVIPFSSGRRQTLLSVVHWVVVLNLSFTALGVIANCVFAIASEGQYFSLVNCFLAPFLLCFTWTGCKRRSQFSDDSENQQNDQPTDQAE